jgi:hypothetical protein
MKRIIDLSGPDGNAYCLMAICTNFAKQMEFPKEKIDGIINDMKSRDYEHLKQVMLDNFGDFIEFQETDDDNTWDDEDDYVDDYNDCTVDMEY